MERFFAFKRFYKLLFALLLIVHLDVQALDQIQAYDKTWYDRARIFALLYYVKARKFLYDHNIFAPREDLTTKICKSSEIFYRTADGTCNDPKISLMGSSNTAFSRMMEDAYAPRRSLEVSDKEPDVRILSRELLERKGAIKKTINSNLLASAFLQFNTHDWLAHKTYKDTVNLHVHPLSKNDPLFVKYGQKEMLFPMTVDESPQSPTPLFKNEATHWFDGSQLYGSDLETQIKLRTMQDGLMKLENGFLPLDENGEEMAGNTSNWWIGLSVLHTLFVREHNVIAKELKQRYPNWDDEKIFQTARLINSAVITKIFLTEQVMPRIVNKNFHLINLSNWYGLVNALASFTKLGKKFEYKKLGEVNLKPPYEVLPVNELSGLVGGKYELNGVPFSMTEEWAQLYRYHAILPDDLNIQASKDNILQKIPLQNTRGKEARNLIKKHGWASVMRGFGYQAGGTSALHNNPKFFSELELPMLGRVDLSALDLFRERERGIPKFNQLRRLLGLPIYKSFSELTSNVEDAELMKKLYHNDIESLDSTIGFLAEEPPEGLELGETVVHMLSLLASRRIESDRFYTTDFNAKVYTQYGIDWINAATIKKIISRNFPELAEELKDVTNPLARWDKKVLDTVRN